MANFVEIDAKLINLDQVTHIETVNNGYYDDKSKGQFFLHFCHGDTKVLSIAFMDNTDCMNFYKEWKQKLVKGKK